jgi:SAM-dependent MidA family methyltransferase
VICAEWADDLPCTVATRVEGTLRLLEVDQQGRERLGAAPDLVDRAWAARWSPDAPRLEIGTTRDRAWGSVCRLLRAHGGLALLIDYGHLSDDRPHDGTLAAYRQGRRVHPRPSVDLNLTAAVAVDSLAEAGHRLGATTVLRARQHQMIPSPADDPTDPLATLVARSHHAAVTSPRIWGDHWWLLQHLSPARSPA